MTVSPKNVYSNETERVNYYIDGDFKLKETMAYTKISRRFLKGYVENILEQVLLA